MSKKLTHEEFVEKLLKKNKHYANGDFVFTGEYVGSNDPIGCHCNIHNKSWTPLPVELCRGKGCPDCGRESSAKNRAAPLERFLQKLNSKKTGVVLDGEYVNMTTKTRFKCSKNHTWFATPNQVLNMPNGCPYCHGMYVWIGFNDLLTTRPDVARLLKNKEDGYKYTQNSNQRVEFVCPDCKTVVVKKINDVSNKGFSCQICSDGISYPNKFGRAFLKQLPIDFLKPEYQPSWAKPYFYDNYFEYNNQKYIVEMDGAFHYIEKQRGTQTLKERQRIDALKTCLANQNDVKIIRIDCLLSDCDYIKNNILNSELNNIFDLSNINWRLCDMSAQKSLVALACKLYQSGVRQINDLAKELGISKTTVTKYLQKGSQLGLCDYQLKRLKLNKTKDKM